MRKLAIIILGCLIFLSGCQKKEPMQVGFKEERIVAVGQRYYLADFVDSISNGELILDQTAYEATRPGTYTYELQGIDSAGKPQTFTLEIEAVASSEMPPVVEPFNMEIVSIGVEGFPINYDLIDSDLEEYKAAGEYFGTLPETYYDGFNYYQMPYYNFLFSVPAQIDSRMKLYVRFIDESDTVIFGLYLPDPSVAEWLQFEAAWPIEEFVVIDHEAGAEDAVGAFVMQLGENYVYYGPQSTLESDAETSELIERFRSGRPYITIYN